MNPPQSSLVTPLQSTSSMVPATPSSSESSDHDPCLSNNDEPVTVSLVERGRSEQMLHLLGKGEAGGGGGGGYH